MFSLRHLILFLRKSTPTSVTSCHLVYASYIAWHLKSRLLAVRQFNPTTETLESHRLSELLESYLESVLEEYDLDVSMIFSATSDSGSDVKRLCDVLLPGLWEWCVCHMLNCSLVEVRLDCWVS